MSGCWNGDGRYGLPHVDCSGTQFQIQRPNHLNPAHLPSRPPYPPVHLPSVPRPRFARDKAEGVPWSGWGCSVVRGAGVAEGVGPEPVRQHHPFLVQRERVVPLPRLGRRTPPSFCWRQSVGIWGIGAGFTPSDHIGYTDLDRHESHRQLEARRFEEVTRDPPPPRGKDAHTDMAGAKPALAGPAVAFHKHGV